MAAVVPNPLRIACTECHRDMRVEFQSHEAYNDSVIVAAECDCGRVFAEVDGILVTQGWGTKERPIIAACLIHRSDIGTFAKERLGALRDRIAFYERIIGVATWAHEKLRKEPREP